MTKKDYEAFAKLFNCYLNSPYSYGAGNEPNKLMDLLHDVADYMEKDNPRFDRTRFLTACGV